MHEVRFVLVAIGKYGVFYSKKSNFPIYTGTKNFTKKVLMVPDYLSPEDTRRKKKLIFEWGQTHFGPKIAIGEAIPGSLNKILPLKNFFCI